MVHRVADDGLRRDLVLPQDPCLHEVGIRFLRGPGVELAGAPLPIDAAVRPLAGVGSQAPGAAPLAVGEVEDVGQDQPFGGRPVPVEVDLRLVVVVLALHQDGAVAGVVELAVVVLPVGREGRPAPVGVEAWTTAFRVRDVDPEGARVPGVEGGDGLLVEALSVALRGAGDEEVDLVLVGRQEAQGAEVGPGRCPCLVGNAVAGLAGKAEGEGGPAVDQPGGEPDPGLVEGAAAGLLLDMQPAPGTGDVGDDVEGAAHRGDGEVRGSQPALHLDRRGGVPKAVEVGPVDPAVLHVVDGHAVDHDGDVALVEPPEADAGIAGAAALIGGVHAGRVVQDQGQVPGAEFAVHLRLGNVREGDRCFPQSGPVGHDDDLLPSKDLGHQLDEHLHVGARDDDRPAELLVPDEARHQGIAAGGDAADLEPPVGARGGAPVRALQVDVRARQGVPGPGVAHPALEHGRGQGGVGEQQEGESREDALHGSLGGEGRLPTSAADTGDGVR